MKTGPSEAIIQKKLFLRCNSHSDTNLSGIVLLVAGQTLGSQALMLSITTKQKLRFWLVLL